MPSYIKSYDNKNKPMIDQDNETLSMTYFNLLKLNENEKYVNSLKGFESVYVVLQGKCDIEVDGHIFRDVGQRKDIWSGQADSVYVGINSEIKLVSNSNNTKIAVAGGKCDKSYEAFRVAPEEVEMVDVGSVKTHSHRRIYHILGHNAEGRTGNLLVSELYSDESCWSGYPPHKHCKDIKSESGFEETGFEEVYHYRYNPSNGFGGQFLFDDADKAQCQMIRDGDTVLIEDGYHPTVTSPGHECYIFTILVGHTQRSLIQNFKKEYRHLMAKIPGINDMRDKFK